MSARRLFAVITVSVALVAGTNASASAYRGDHVGQIRAHTRGGCVRNTKTHVEDCVKGWHKFHQRVGGHRHTFWEPVVSAQRCKPSGCWGHIWSGTMPHRWRLGRKGALPSRGGGCGGFFSPWAICWADQQITKAVQAVDHHVVQPCVFGSADGFGSALIWNLSVKTMFRGGVITAAQAGKYFTGPVGFGIVTVATCGIGVYQKGLDSVQGLFD